MNGFIADRLEAKIARHEEAAAAARAQLATLEAYPEPAGPHPVVRWDMQFTPPSGLVYNYAAIKAGDGRWYAAGPNAPFSVSWEILLDFILRNLVGEIWELGDGE